MRIKKSHLPRRWTQRWKPRIEKQHITYRIFWQNVSNKNRDIRSSEDWMAWSKAYPMKRVYQCTLNHTNLFSQDKVARQRQWKLLHLYLFVFVSIAVIGFSKKIYLIWYSFLYYLFINMRLESRISSHLRTDLGRKFVKKPKPYK